MRKSQNSQAGFSAVEVVVVLVIVALIGTMGIVVYKHQNKTTADATAKTAAAATTKSTANPEPASSAAMPPAEAYAGWKTYTSSLKSGLSFKYPADWYFPSADLSGADAINTNNNGGTSSSHVMYSVEPTGTSGNVTNQYMCVVIDEYSGTGWSGGDWDLGKQLTSENYKVGSTPVTLATFAGDTPMQTEILLYTPNNPAGNHFFSTQNKFIATGKAGFNSCQQSTGGQGITNQTADFSTQSETKTAELILKSIKF